MYEEVKVSHSIRILNIHIDTKILEFKIKRSIDVARLLDSIEQCAKAVRSCPKNTNKSLI